MLRRLSLLPLVSPGRPVISPNSVHSVCTAVPGGSFGGASVRAKINKTSVDKLVPGDFIADTEVKNFTARCLPSGVVTYAYRYRVKGKQRWLPLGLHGGITPQQARTLAKKRAGEVADGRDPVAE